MKNLIKLLQKIRGQKRLKKVYAKKKKKKEKKKAKNDMQN